MGISTCSYKLGMLLRPISTTVQGYDEAGRLLTISSKRNQPRWFALVMCGADERMKVSSFFCGLLSLSHGKGGGGG